MNRWFHPAFETDLIEAARYIEKRRCDFGTRFLDEAEVSVELIVQSPEIGRLWRRDIRRFILRQFRYTIRYRIRRDENVVEVLSITHTSRHPDTGVDR